MNLVATHYNCTSPMDYIPHHALHTHTPVHHYTNHTAVTIHSLVLIVSPHLHLIHSHTFKQHSHMHSLRSLVSAPANISERSSWYFWSSVYDLGLFTWLCDSLPPALVTWYLDYLLLLLSAACLDLSLVFVYEFDPVSITPVAGIRSLPV